MLNMKFSSSSLKILYYIIIRNGVKSQGKTFLSEF